MRGVDCVCATEPPWCSSESKFGDAGAAWLAQALEKNTTLQTLDLNGEFVVLWCVWGGGLIVVYVVVGCCWSVLLVLRGVSVVLIVCVPLNRRVNQTTNLATRALHRWRKL